MLFLSLLGQRPAVWKSSLSNVHVVDLLSPSLQETVFFFRTLQSGATQTITGNILNSAAWKHSLDQLKLNQRQLKSGTKRQKRWRYFSYLEYRNIYFSEWGLYVRMSAIFVIFQIGVSRNLTAVRTSNNNDEKFVTITTLWGLLITVHTPVWLQSIAAINVCAHRLITTELTDVECRSVFGLCLLHIPTARFEAEGSFRSSPRQCQFNILETKRSLLYIRRQSVPLCKHFPPRFVTTSQLMAYTAKATVCTEMRTQLNAKRAPCRIF